MLGKAKKQEASPQLLGVVSEGQQLARQESTQVCTADLDLEPELCWGLGQALYLLEQGFLQGGASAQRREAWEQQSQVG